MQHPVQRSLTPKWDLSWVLVSLQKSPFEPLRKAKLHVTIKTAFLSALATAKRCSEIHALVMDPNHLSFNQSDGSISLIVQTGFLAKNQLLSICPDPIVIPSLAPTGTCRQTFMPDNHRHSGSVVERPLCEREVAGSIPSRVIPKTLEKVLADLSLGTQH